MKKGMWSLGVVVLAGLLFLAVGTLIAADKTEPPDEMVIDSQGYTAKKKGPCPFKHKEHVEKYKVACTECHHVYKDGKNVWKKGDPVKKCSTCHSPEKKEGKVLKLNVAFHKNCKDCHKKVDEQDPSKKAPFKKCNDCHEKK